MALARSRLSKSIIYSLLAGIAAAFSAFGAWYFEAIRQPKVVDLKHFARKTEDSELFDSVQLRTLSVPDAIRRHLLDGDFAIAHRMQDIPGDCTVVSAANPGQDVNYGDSIVEGLPYRQLHFAGIRPKSCFMFYQRGGNNYPSSCLAILDRLSGKIIWLGVTRKDGANLQDLRWLLSRHQFDDTGEPDC